MPNLLYEMYLSKVLRRWSQVVVVSSESDSYLGIAAPIPSRRYLKETAKLSVRHLNCQ